MLSSLCHLTLVRLNANHCSCKYLYPADKISPTPRAAEIAGVKVMQLVNGNVGGKSSWASSQRSNWSAVAINYGVFRRTEFNETERNLMFYDMGSQATTATIVGYSTVKEKGKDVPQLHVKSVG